MFACKRIFFYNTILRYISILLQAFDVNNTFFYIFLFQLRIEPLVNQHGSMISDIHGKNGDMVIPHWQLMGILIILCLTVRSWIIITLTNQSGWLILENRQTLMELLYIHGKEQDRVRFYNCLKIVLYFFLVIDSVFFIHDVLNNITFKT